MFVFWKIWRALFSWNNRYEYRPFALLPTIWIFVDFKRVISVAVNTAADFVCIKPVSPMFSVTVKLDCFFRQNCIIYKAMGFMVFNNKMEIMHVNSEPQRSQ